MARRRSHLGRRTRGAEAARRVIANQTEEERASAKEQNRQRIAQIRAKESAEQRAARLENARLRARRLRSAAKNLLRSQQNERDRLSVVERYQREITDQLYAQQSRDYNHLAFQYNPADVYSLSQDVLIGTMIECSYCKALKFNGETKGMCCCAAGNIKLPQLGELSELYCQDCCKKINEQCQSNNLDSHMILNKQST